MEFHGRLFHKNCFALVTPPVDREAFIEAVQDLDVRVAKVVVEASRAHIENLPTWHPDWQPNLSHGDSITIQKPRFLRQTEADRYHEEEITLP